MGEKSSLPPIAWAANDGHLILWLIDLIQEHENFIVLFGKKDPKEVCKTDEVLWQRF
jgi:hypothetical protein